MNSLERAANVSLRRAFPTAQLFLLFRVVPRNPRIPWQCSRMPVAATKSDSGATTHPSLRLRMTEVL